MVGKVVYKALWVVPLGCPILDSFLVGCFWFFWAVSAFFLSIVVCFGVPFVFSLGRGGGGGGGGAWFVPFSLLVLSLSCHFGGSSFI